MSSLASPTASPSSGTPNLISRRPRCQHVSRNGRPCRYRAVSAKEPFCKHHLPEGSTEQFSELLEKMAENFDTPEGVTNVLHSIFFWCAYGYISERKAGVLTYVAQTILNSQRTDIQLQRTLALAAREGLPIFNPYTAKPFPEDQPHSSRESSARPDNQQDPRSSPCRGGFTPPDPVAEAGPSLHPEKPGATTNCPASSLPQTPPALSLEDSAKGGSSLADSLQGVGASAPTTTPLPSPSFSSRALQPAQNDSSPSPKSPPPKTPVLDLNHFFPRDPSLPRHLQDQSNEPPPLSARLFNSRVRSVNVRRPHPNDDDWTIINAR